MKKNKILLVLVCAILCVCVIFCIFFINWGKGESNISTTSSSAPLTVVAANFPAYDFVRQITADSPHPVAVTQLLPPGAESHSYEPTPQDILTIENCDLFVYVGGESDYWVESILDSMGEKKPKTFALMDYVTLMPEEITEGMTVDHEHGDEDEKSHKEVHNDDTNNADDIEYDEHVWTSPKRVISIIPHLTNALSELAPSQASHYQKNADSYIASLSRLDADLTTMISNASRKTIVVGDRFPFRYLAADYNLNCYGAFPGCSTEVEPSAATIAFLTDTVKQMQLPAVLYIEFSNHKVADSVAEHTKTKTMLLHSCHNVTKQELQDGVTYQSLMEKNIQVLKEALN